MNRKIKRSFRPKKVAHKRAAYVPKSSVGGAILNAIGVGMLALTMGLTIASLWTQTSLYEKLERIESSRQNESANDTIDEIGNMEMMYEKTYKEAYAKAAQEITVDMTYATKKTIDSLNNVIIRYDELLQFYVASPTAIK
jgi:hypothetical protein